jgi:predicted NUDIX family NTP pyrophosphohydrolase
VDRAAWFRLAEARKKMQIGQAPFIDRLIERLASEKRG